MRGTENVIETFFEFIIGVTCGEPPVVPLTSVDYNGMYTGFTARYRCDKGYNLQGESGVLVCQQDGDWAGKRPECKSRYFYKNVLHCNNVCCWQGPHG